MDVGNLNLALKMIEEEYKLSATQLQTLSRRMLADDKEFERVWSAYKSVKSRKFEGGVDRFKEILSELIS